MTRSTSLALVAACCFCVGAIDAPSGAHRVKVLLVTGGHDFEREPFLDVFRANPAIDVTHAEHADGSANAFDRFDPSAYDVVVLYDMPPAITDAQRTRFLSMFPRGVGLVAMHHALVSYQTWPDYERIIGGRWIDPAKGGDPTIPAPGYEHDVDFRVRVAPGHPVTDGVGDFDIHDEIYWGYRVGADVTALATTPHPKSGNPLMWVRTEGSSRVVYLLLGHGPSAFSHPAFRRLVANAIQWTARRPS